MNISKYVSQHVFNIAHAIYKQLIANITSWIPRIYIEMSYWFYISNIKEFNHYLKKRLQPKTVTCGYRGGEVTVFSH
jgi:hypothetical protein